MPQIPPGPKHRFLGANGSISFYTDIAGYLEKKKKKFGDFVLLRAAGHPIYVVTKLDYVEQILLKDYKNFTKGVGYQRSRVILGNGIFTSDGDFHDKQRKLINPSFHKTRINEYYRAVAKCNNELICSWEKSIPSSSNFEMLKEMTRLFIAIIFDSLFSSDSNDELINWGVEFTELFHGTNPILLLNPQLALKFPLPSIRKFIKVKTKIDKLFEDIIRKRRKESAQSKHDVLSMIMRSEDADGNTMSDKTLFDEIRTVFIAANDTSAKVMSWILYELTQQNHVREKLENEIEFVLNGRFPEYDDFDKLEYTKMVVQEGLRLYPPLWMITRTPTEDFYLDDYLIRKDSSIFIVLYLIQRDEKYYYQPEQFIPERWTEEEKKKRPRLSFIPFGAGPRICLGESFSMFHLVITLVAICQKFRFKLHPEQKIKISSSLTLKPKYGMNMILECK